MTELVTVGGGLPYVLELQTGKVLDILLGVLETDRTRKQVNDWLYRNSSPNFVFSFQPRKELHLTYADQRDGHGTAHWWRLSYGDCLKSQIEAILKGTAITTTPKEIPKNQANSGVRAEHSWFGMYFRSRVEMKMAQELQKRGVTFFANARGCYSLEGSPVSAQYLNGRVEVDFLIFYKGKCVILQIDGPQHKGQRARDYAGDRHLSILGEAGSHSRRFKVKTVNVVNFE